MRTARGYDEDKMIIQKMSINRLPNRQITLLPILIEICNLRVQMWEIMKQKTYLAMRFWRVTKLQMNGISCCKIPIYKYRFLFFLSARKTFVKARMVKLHSVQFLVIVTSLDLFRTDQGIFAGNILIFMCTMCSENFLK